MNTGTATTRQKLSITLAPGKREILEEAALAYGHENLSRALDYAIQLYALEAPATGGKVRNIFAKPLDTESTPDVDSARG